MEEEERLQILRYIYNKNFLCNKLSRFRADYKLELPDKTIPIAIWKIKQRLLEREGLKEYRSDPNFGDLITIIFPSGELHKHRDPNGGDLSIHTRFNIFLQLPDKHDTYYGGDIVESKEGHYVMCRSGIDFHWSDTNNELLPRIALSFGFMLPLEKVNTLYKIPGINTNTDILTVIATNLSILAKSIILTNLPPSLQYNIIREKGKFQDMMQTAISRIENFPGSLSAL
jgi:hypothetical protein